MKINLTLDWKTILKLIGGAIFGWLVRHLLDNWKTFEFLMAKYKEQDVEGKAKSLLGTTVTILDIIVFLVLATIGYLILSWLFKLFFGKEQRIKKGKIALQKMNSKDIGDIVFHYDVEFDIDDKLYIDNLVPYCKKHGSTPIKMLPNYFNETINCSVPNCLTKIDNPKYVTDGPISRITNMIISELEQHCRDLNK